MSLSRLLGFALALLSFVVTLAASRDARCDPAGPRAYPLYVLAVDTDDADDQSEALTGALRSRVRGAPGWSLSETTLTLSMLTAALKCPKVPDAACLVKIGDQLKADRFMWGTLQKVPGNMVKVDLHLWARGKADVTATDSYTENLKDQNDERLQRVAQRLFDRLTGGASSGSLVIRAGDAGGVVMVDGQRKGALEKGEATLDLPAGTHAIEVRVPGFAWAKESVTITAGKEARVTVSLVAEGAPPGEPASAGPSGRKVAGWAAVGVGAALLIAGGVEGIVYLGKKSDQDNVDRTLFGGSDVCAPTLPDPKDPRYAQAKQVTSEACSRSQDAKNVSTLGIIFGAAGVVATSVGLYLVLTDGGSSSEKSGPKFEDRAAKASGLKVRLVPEVSPRGQGLLLQGTF